MLIAPGGDYHLCLERTRPNVELIGSEKVAGHRPAVDVLFGSLARLGDKVVATLLTGMGRDGANGMKGLRASGAMTIAQDEATCVVYGMPRAAVELEAACEVLPLNKIGDALLAQAAVPASRTAKA